MSLGESHVLERCPRGGRIRSVPPNSGMRGGSASVLIKPYSEGQESLPTRRYWEPRCPQNPARLGDLDVPASLSPPVSLRLHRDRCRVQGAAGALMRGHAGAGSSPKAPRGSAADPHLLPPSLPSIIPGSCCATSALPPGPPLPAGRQSVPAVPRLSPGCDRPFIRAGELQLG